MSLETGLFAATVATFVVSSLPMLSPDTGGQTVVLLTQVLATISNPNDTVIFANAGSMPVLPAFEVSESARAINILWLVSLVLALIGALFATLVQQWARTYIDHVRRHPSPRQRGIIYATLILGIKRFRMKDTVAAIVTLVHVSVFLFFAGMIVLMFTTDTVIAVLLGALIGLSLMVYLVLSSMPIFWHDSPYHTPLSPLLLTIIRIGYRIAWVTLDTVHIFIGRENIRNVITSTTQVHAARDEFLSLESSDWMSIQMLFGLHAFAFTRALESANALQNVLSFWDNLSSFLSSSKTDPDLARSIRLFTVCELRLFDRINSMLDSQDRSYQLGYMIEVICSMAHNVIVLRERNMAELEFYMQFLIQALESWKTAPNIYADSGTTVAFDMYSAELRVDILDSASNLMKDSRELRLSKTIIDGIVYLHGDVFLAYPEVEIREGDFFLTPDTSTSRGRGTNLVIDILLVHNFLAVYRKILSWANAHGVTQILTILRAVQSSWLPLMRRIHKHALTSAGVSHALTFFADISRPSLQGQTIIGKLLMDLEILDYRHLQVDDEGTFAYPPIASKQTVYGPFFAEFPELARLLYSICTMLRERRDVTGTPFTQEIPRFRVPTNTVESGQGTLSLSPAYTNRSPYYPTPFNFPHISNKRRADTAGTPTDAARYDNIGTEVPITSPPVFSRVAGVYVPTPASSHEDSVGSLSVVAEEASLDGAVDASYHTGAAPNIQRGREVSFAGPRSPSEDLAAGQTSSSSPGGESSSHASMTEPTSPVTGNDGAAHVDYARRVLDQADGMHDHVTDINDAGAEEEGPPAFASTLSLESPESYRGSTGSVSIAVVEPSASEESNQTSEIDSTSSLEILSRPPSRDGSFTEHGRSPQTVHHRQLPDHVREAVTVRTMLTSPEPRSSATLLITEGTPTLSRDNAVEHDSPSGRSPDHAESIAGGTKVLGFGPSSPARSQEGSSGTYTKAASEAIISEEHTGSEVQEGSTHGAMFENLLDRVEIMEDGTGGKVVSLGAVGEEQQEGASNREQSDPAVDAHVSESRSEQLDPSTSAGY